MTHKFSCLIEEEIEQMAGAWINYVDIYLKSIKQTDVLVV